MYIHDADQEARPHGLEGDHPARRARQDAQGGPGEGPNNTSNNNPNNDSNNSTNDNTSNYTTTTNNNDNNNSDTNKDDVMKKWSASACAKKLSAKETRAGMGDLIMMIIIIIIMIVIIINII